MSVIQFLIRVLYFITTATLWYFSLLWLAIPFLLLYTYRFRAYEIVVLGLLLDMQFITSGYVPQYTIVFTAWVMIAEWLKPQLRARIE